MDILDRIAKSNVFSTIDLKKAFYQIPTRSEDRHKTAVITPFGLLEYATMPFGLWSASQVFQRYMNNILANITEFAPAYIDDIIFSDNAVHHENISEIRDILNKADVEIIHDKCSLNLYSVKFLQF